MTTDAAHHDDHEDEQEDGDGNADDEREGEPGGDEVIGGATERHFGVLEVAIGSEFGSRKC
ncbi:uncharacterized protein BDZ99DRAFT_460846 [Mytilinidion resinicola]|uniref:Uncharacterized protein n=1 Tax=Mytilinidion resinicola TaxID=574789 RepID=A0A6A6YTG6_9PEZI|nr:uncharacterized protein BDZ99DRAFT_460846 [Mytilinidion resinicola]KAF2812061.1 hypothetical protein BDZ99DRAFT_460846 [Mytilinidion resinicola]